MQIIELYIKGSGIRGNIDSVDVSGFILTDSEQLFTNTVSVNDIIINENNDASSRITEVISDTQIRIADFIFASGSSYLVETDYIRMDLFDDESVSVTDSLLNIRDISKVFVPFSKQFSLPASKQNNKLFRHYENTDVLNSYDARFRNDAIIKLNGNDYKKGKIQFKSVDLKNNSPYAFKVVFFGETVDLKEVLAEDDLSALQFPDSFNFEYSEANIIDRFTNQQEELSVANIHHSKNMRFTDDGYKDNITGTGLGYQDLKPAIPVYRIIEAISNTYPSINFNTGFFNRVEFRKVYMWLHKNEGFITNSLDGGGTRTISNDFGIRPVLGTGDDWQYSSGSGDVRRAFFGRHGDIAAFAHRYTVSLTVTAPPTSTYTVTYRNVWNNAVIYEEEQTGGGIATRVITQQDCGDVPYLHIKVELTADSTFAVTQALSVYHEARTSWNWTGIGNSYYTIAADSSTNVFKVSEQLPKMKVIDFLSNLFKMFNLVVYKEGENIQVDSARFFYETGKAWDITRYTDISTSTVERLFQFKNMKFDFKSKKSFLVKYSDEVQGNKFSQESYGNDKWDGGDYNVEVDFEKMMYERLNNENTGDLTTISQGAMLDSNFEPTIGKPLLFYMITRNSGGNISIGDTPVASYNSPSQLPSNNFWGINTPKISLNFGSEMDEFSRTIGEDRNLFSEYYLDQVQTGFDVRSRLLKISAYLPLGLISQYKMNDVFVIANKPYIINKITTNLLTNKSDLELYTRLDSVSQIENNQNAFLSTVTNLTVTTLTNNSISIQWDSLNGTPDLDGYDLYIEGAYIETIPSNITTKTIAVPETDTFYQISLRPKYTNSLTETAFAYDTTIGVQTPK